MDASWVVVGAIMAFLAAVFGWDKFREGRSAADGAEAAEEAAKEAIEDAEEREKASIDADRAAAAAKSGVEWVTGWLRTRTKTRD
jgi:hypothetical protein